MISETRRDANSCAKARKIVLAQHVHQSGEHDKQGSLISCIMPTYNRRMFVSQGIGYFLRQTYPTSELIIVDDGSDSVEDLIPEDSRIKYLRIDEEHRLGEKRYLACEAARGEIIVHWDDDNWMAARRIDYQIKALLKSDADIGGLPDMLYYEPGAGRA